jgi:hypothetical protein
MASFVRRDELNPGHQLLAAIVTVPLRSQRPSPFWAAFGRLHACNVFVRQAAWDYFDVVKAENFQNLDRLGVLGLCHLSFGMSSLV